MYCIRGLAVLLIQSVLLPAFVAACDCSPVAYAPACQEITTAAVVFVGSVVDIEPDPMMPNVSRARVYHFDVEQAYKGIPTGAHQVIVNPDNFTDCGAEYHVGTRYLIFGSPMPGSAVVFSGECSGSRPADTALEDIRFLEQYAAKQSHTQVFGKVLQWVGSFSRLHPEEDMPIPGALVTLVGSSVKRTHVSGADGAFRFEDIGPGSYAISAEGLPYGPGPAPVAATVTAGTCAEVFLPLPAHAELSGSVRTFNGSPAKDISVELLRRNTSGRWISTSQFWKYTDANGDFAFPDLPAGDYLLGYEIWRGKPSYDSPFETQYYPGVRDLNQAAILHLDPRQELKNVSFSLPKPDTPRRIQAVVMWPDGQPISHNLLQLFNGNELVKNLDGHHDGIFTFTGFDHRSYELSVRYWIDELGGPVPHDRRRIAKSNVVKVSPGKGPVTIKLILVRTLLADDER